MPDRPVQGVIASTIQARINDDTVDFTLIGFPEKTRKVRGDRLAARLIFNLVVLDVERFAVTQESMPIMPVWVLLPKW